jgi:hypothetical protein
MSRRLASARGVSLVEATIILATLAVLAAIVAPAIGTYVNDANSVAAAHDTETIGSGILQLLQDTGSRCLRLVGTTDCTLTNRVDLLVSGGKDPDSVSPADITLPDSESASYASVNWLPDAQAPTQRDTIDDQLIENDNATPYPAASFSAGGGPRMKLGWRGAYLNGPIASDPWGYKYQVNTIFLTVATNAFDTAASPDQSQEGLRESGWKRAVMVLSPGANGAVQTSFGGPGAGSVSAVGDDVIYIIGGTTR